MFDAEDLNVPFIKTDFLLPDSLLLKNIAHF